MYRLLNSLLLFLIFIFSTSPLRAQSLCREGDLASNRSCLIKDKEAFYIYNSPYNGRNDGPNTTVFTTMTPDIIPEKGFYNEATAIWPLTSSLAPNIKKGVELFGVVGELDDSVTYQACNNNNTDTEPLWEKSNPACLVPPGAYFYITPYGGRSKQCTFDSVNKSLINNGPCWLSSPLATGKIVRTTEGYNNCPFGKVGALCTHKNIYSEGYYYNAEYGGRGKLCCNGESGPCTITSACYISASQVPAEISETTPCKENGTLINMPIGAGTISYYATNDNDAKNTTSCVTRTDPVNNKTARYVYTQPYGGRVSCADDDGGYCWFNSAKKSTVFNGLAIEVISGKNYLSNIAVGTSVFGIPGNYSAQRISYGTGAHKNKSASLTTSNQITYEQEIALTTPLPVAKPQYHGIPKIALDSDGFGKASQVAAVNRSTWSTKTCGLTVTDEISARIANCATVMGSEATWNGSARGNAGQTTWYLVARYATGGYTYEVWQDSKTKLLWSSLVHKASNWCHASGANNSDNHANSHLKSADKNQICENEVYQKKNKIGGASDDRPYSLCFEDSAIFNPAPSGSNLYLGHARGKAGMGVPSEGSTELRVQWRLPTMYDYLLANHHGLRFVLPDVGQEEWSATVSASDSSKAWIFDSTTGALQRRVRTASMGVRCVGR